MSQNRNDQDKLARALKAAASLYGVTIDEDTLELLLQEAEYPSHDSIPADRTLEEVEASPLVASLSPHMVLLDVEEPLLYLAEVLDQWDRPEIEEARETVKVHDCEMCERNMPLTIHHLLPVSLLLRFASSSSSSRFDARRNLSVSLLLCALQS